MTADNPRQTGEGAVKPPENDAPGGYGRVARRISGWTSNLLVVALLVALGLATGRQLIEWWRSEPAELGTGPRADFAQGLAEPGALQFIEFGGSGWVMGRQDVEGDVAAASKTLREIARAAAAKSAIPTRPITPSERRTLDELARRKPVEAQGNWALFEMRPGFPMLLGVRWAAGETAAEWKSPARQAGPTGKAGQTGRVVLSAVGVPAGEKRWTLFTFGFEGRDAPPAAGGIDVPLPPGAVRTLGIRAAGGAAIVSFQRAAEAAESMAFYDQWFAARQWTATGAWTERGSAHQARFSPRQTGQRGLVDIRLDIDGTGLIVVTP